MIGSALLYLSTFTLSCFFSCIYEHIEKTNCSSCKNKFYDNFGRRFRISRVIRLAINKTDIEKMILCVLVILPPVLIMTFRDLKIGVDLVGHVDYYHRVKSIPISQYIIEYENYGIEIGFQIISRIAFLLGDNIKLFLSEIAVIPMIFIWKGIAYYHKKFNIGITISLFMFYMVIWPYCMAITRYGIALSIFFFSFRYIIEQKPIKFALCVGLMTLFHTSLILSILYYVLGVLINEKNAKKGKYIAIIVIATSVTMIRPTMLYLSNHLDLIGKYDFYQFDANSAYGLQAFIFPWIYLFPVVFNWNSLINKDKAWIYLLSASATFIPMSFFMYYNVWLTRLTRVPQILFIPIFASFFSSQEKQHTKSLIFKAYIITLIIVTFLIDGPIGDAFHEYPFLFAE